MTKKRKIIRIDGDKNADWIKSLPGHKDELQIHGVLAKKIAKKPSTKKKK